MICVIRTRTLTFSRLSLPVAGEQVQPLGEEDLQQQPEPEDGHRDPHDRADAGAEVGNPALAVGRIDPEWDPGPPRRATFARKISSSVAGSLAAMVPSTGSFEASEYPPVGPEEDDHVPEVLLEYRGRSSPELLRPPGRSHRALRAARCRRRRGIERHNLADAKVIVVIPNRVRSDARSRRRRNCHIRRLLDLDFRPRGSRPTRPAALRRRTGRTGN